MSNPATDFYTYRGDVRHVQGGNPVAFTVASGLTNLASGEMMAFKTADATAVRFVKDGTAGRFIGISRDSQLGVAKLGNQAALLQSVQIDFSVFTTGIHLMQTVNGVTYNHGDALYMNGTDTQQVTDTAGTAGVQVGVVWLPQASPITGAAGVRVPMLIDDYTAAAH